MGLNPFEFRAGLERRLPVDRVGALPVLIPLNSGLAWSAEISLTSVHEEVLIPLNSGLAWSPPDYNETTERFGLNPFEFRAGLERVSATSNHRR